MGSVRKASAWLGLVEDNDDERYYDDDGTPRGTAPGEGWVTDPRVQVASEAAQETGPPDRHGHPGQLPRRTQIGELFRDGVPVIMNLTAMEPADAKRWWTSPPD